MNDSEQSRVGQKIKHRPFGWLIAGTLLGAAVAASIADGGIRVGKGHVLDAARVRAAERMVPFVIIGCVIGLLAGMIAERIWPGMSWPETGLLLTAIAVSLTLIIPGCVFCF